VRALQPGSEFGGFRIEAVEREAVFRARDEHREVALHVASEPPAALATIRFLERARRLRSIQHPHLLAVYVTEMLDGHCVAITQAPPGRRLDRMRPECVAAIRTVRQVAEAVDALEAAGAEPPPLNATRIWVDEHGDARLDGLDAHAAPHPAASSSAALAHLLRELQPRRRRTLEPILTRATDGAYLSAGQFAGRSRRSNLNAAETER